MNTKRKHITDTSFLFIAMIFVNAGNYLINLALGRFLGPEAFAEASVIATIVLMLSFVAIGIQLTSAKYSASESETVTRNRIINWIEKKVTIISIFIACVMLLICPWIQSYLHFDSILPLLLIAVCLPLFFNLSVKRGWLQGTEQFQELAKSYLFEMLLRMSITFVAILLALKYFNAQTTLAVAVGFLASFLVAFLFRIEKSDPKVTEIQKTSIIKFVAIIGLYELSQIVINNSDVILAKHFFDAKQAGIYAAIALIGRVVYFGTWTIVTLLFPKVIQKERDGLPHAKLFWNALAIVAGIGGVIVLACYAFPSLIINILFGSEYLVAKDLLWIYAVSTTLFACANVFAYYHLSLNNYLPVAITMIAGVLQLILINHYHETLLQVIQVQLCLMGALFIVMTLYHITNGIFHSKKNNLLHRSLNPLT